MKTEYEEEMYDESEEESKYYDSEGEEEPDYTFISMKTVYNYENGYDERWTNKKGELDREDGPAYTSVQGNMVKLERWHHKGLLHRESGPAVTYYHHGPDRKIVEYKEFHVKGKHINTVHDLGFLSSQQ